MMAGAVVALRFVSLSTRRYMKGVADFLSANRSAGRYLLTIAMSMGGTGAISVVGMFEVYHRAGFPPVWWATIALLVNTIAILSGWVYYRFRETRSLTMAQFLEMRYSRRFRILAGMVCFTSGILNFGIFPAVAARFFVYFCGLPEHFHPLPGLEFQMSTFAFVMAVDMILALTFVTMGGQISVMVTECVQGIFSGFAFLVIAAAALLLVKWPHVIAALTAAPANASMLNPYQTSHVKDVNVWYYIIVNLSALYGYMSWQGAQGFNSSGRSPHEQRMGNIIAIWKEMPKTLMILVLPIAAYAVLNLPEFASKAAVITENLKNIDNDAIRNQMTVPVALAHILPLGIKGLFATVMLFFSFTCHDTYMHSWGSIFVQDVVMPLRKKPLDTQQHIRLLRWSIIGVAVFAFTFSLLYQQNTLIIMFFAITGTIWIAGSGACITGGLYWSRGTTAGAYTALILGATLGLAGLFVPQIYQSHYHREFPLNGAWMLFCGMVLAGLSYVVVSLLTGSKETAFNLEKMLCRGRYARTCEPLREPAQNTRLSRLVGITNDFSKWDKFLAIALVAWNFAWIGAFAVVSLISTVSPIGDGWWIKFWHGYILLTFIIGVPTTIWLTVGGIIDIRSLLKSLKTLVRDHTDDGRVIHESEDSGSSGSYEHISGVPRDECVK